MDLSCFGRMLGSCGGFVAAADNRAGLGSETAAALQKEEEEEEEGGRM